MEKKPCPQCAELNYSTSPACWACGAPLVGPRAVQPPAPEPQVDRPDSQQEPDSAGVPDEPPEAPAESEDDGLKPAAREARALRDKAYVTPPVEVEEGPRGLGEWIMYAFHAIGQSTAGFKEALDDYDRRRGRKSGAMSSYGCAVVGMLAALFVALLVTVVSYVTQGRR